MLFLNKALKHMSFFSQMKPQNKPPFIKVRNCPANVAGLVSPANSEKSQESQTKPSYKTETKQVSSLLEVSTMRKRGVRGGGGCGGRKREKKSKQPKSILFLISENLQLIKKRCLYLYIWVYRSIYPLA